MIHVPDKLQRAPFWLHDDRRRNDCVGCSHDEVVAKRAAKYLNLTPEEVLEIQARLIAKFDGNKERASDAWPGWVIMFEELDRPEFRLAHIAVHNYADRSAPRSFHYEVRLWSLT